MMIPSMTRPFAAGKSKVKADGKDYKNYDEEDYYQDDDDAEKEKGPLYNIVNPDIFENDVPFPLLGYPDGCDGFGPEELKAMLDIDDKVIDALKHFYDITDKKKFSIDQCRAICWHFGYELVSEKVAEAKETPRPPIVTIMGHVDHGKTTLLDGYRNSNLTGEEAGGITQKIGAFMVDTSFGPVSFIDTPGHSLFTNMRKTGASCTDIIVLVISSIEGVQNQTHEVLQIIQEGRIPVVIALNKIDAKTADPEAVEEELWKLGIKIEPKGGNIPVVHVSATTRMNTTLLLELILFEAERLKIGANSSKQAQGYAIEGKHVDTKNCSMVLRQGNLQRGDFLISSSSYCKVHKIFSDRGDTVELASAGMAVQIQGFKSLPKTNEKLIAVRNEKEAKEFMKLRDHMTSLQEAKTLSATQVEGTKIKFKHWRERVKFYSGKKEIIEQKYQKMLEEMLEQKVELAEKGQPTDELERRIELHQQTMDRLKSGDKSGLKLYLKANDIGTLDTMITHAMNIKDSNGTRHFEIVKAEVGPITDNDLIESLEFESKIYCMDVTVSSEIGQMIKDEGIDVRSFKIIYQFLEDLEKLNESMNTDYKGIEVTGKATVKELYDIKLGTGSNRNVI